MNNSTASKCIFDYPDVLDNLFMYLSSYDLKNLSLTNSFFTNRTRHALFSRCSATVRNLHEFAESSVAQYVRKLKIQQLKNYSINTMGDSFLCNMPILEEVILSGYQASEVKISSDLLAKLNRFSASVRSVQLPESLPSTLKHLELIDCEYVENPEALSTCRHSLRLENVRLQSPLTLHSSLAHLNITYNIELSDLPPNLKSLTYTNIKHNALPEALPAGLQYLDCSSNDWSSLPNLPSGLKYLDCSDNKIKVIIDLPSSLEVLICDSNELRSLAMLPQSLKMLSSSRNPLFDHFSSSNSEPWPPSLIALRLRFGALCKDFVNAIPQKTALPSLALPATLLFFDCSYNNLTSLPSLPQSLEGLNCYGNRLASLLQLPTSLQVLRCYENKLTCLSTLPKTIRCIHADPDVSIPQLPSLRPSYVHKYDWEFVDSWKDIYTKI